MFVVGLRMDYGIDGLMECSFVSPSEIAPAAPLEPFEVLVVRVQVD